MGWLRDQLRGGPDQPIISRTDTLQRDVQPLEGTNMSLYNSIIPNWWTENGLTSGAPSWMFLPLGTLAEKLWVAAACIQLNAQQIASMPLRFEGPPSATEPTWMSAPDPNWYPNGISDALFSIVADVFRSGFSCLYVTDTYFSGYPRSWTVLDPEPLQIVGRNGQRVYKINDTSLDGSRVVQIDRNPGHRLHGTPALAPYAQLGWGMLAAGNQSLSVNQGGVPVAVLKSQRKLTREQAEEIQTQWMTATQRRNGAPPVLPPELDFTPLQFKPADIQLLESQQWSVAALATAFGIPCVLLNQALTGGLTYQNPAALGEMWWRFTLRPLSKRIADAFNSRMLPAGQYVWFDAADTFMPLAATSEQDDPQAAEPATAGTSPAMQPTPPRLSAIGGNA